MMEPILQYHDADHFKCNDLRRWKLSLGDWFSVRLHHWVTGDPPNYQHMHPWNFLTIVLRGGYDDIGEGRDDDFVCAPAIRYRSLTWRHSIINTKPNTWTIVLTGRVLSKWRFWIGQSEVDEAAWNLRSCD